MALIVREVYYDSFPQSSPLIESVDSDLVISVDAIKVEPGLLR